MQPPMNQSIVVHTAQLDENGQEKKNRNGQVLRVANPSRASVKYSGEEVFDTNGQRAEAVLELRLPAELEARTGDIVEWVDDFGVLVKGPIAKMNESRNYSGTVVYFRRAWTT